MYAIKSVSCTYIRDVQNLEDRFWVNVEEARTVINFALIAIRYSGKHRDPVKRVRPSHSGHCFDTLS